MDILILPYQKKITVKGNVGDITKYTSPLKLFDYLAAGKLIISSNLKVLKEIVTNKKNCILINDFKSLASWINTINYHKKNFEKKNIISKQAHLLARKYTYYNRAKAIIKILNN